MIELTFRLWSRMCAEYDSHQAEDPIITLYEMEPVCSFFVDHGVISGYKETRVNNMGLWTTQYLLLFDSLEQHTAFTLRFA